MWRDSDIRGGKVKLKWSDVEGETAPSLVPGEVAINTADEVIYFSGGSVSTGAGKVASTTVTAIVALTNAEYIALASKSSTTLYVVSDVATGARSIYLGTVTLATAPSL
jgi:hypothetical protein